MAVLVVIGGSSCGNSRCCNRLVVVEVLGSTT